MNEIIFREHDDFSDIVSKPPVNNGETPHSEAITVQYLEVPGVTELSENEFAHDIWLLRRTQNRFQLDDIYRDGILKKMQQYGIYKRFRENGSYTFIRENDNIIEEIDIPHIKDEIFGYVENLSDDLVLELRGVRITIKPEKLIEMFLQKSKEIFNKNFLEHLQTHTKKILRDTKTESYFSFQNAVFKVTKHGIRAIPYADLGELCIWRSHIKPVNLTLMKDFEQCHYVRFLKNVTNNESDRYNAFRSGIGYMLHNFTDPSSGQAVIAYDEEITDLQNPMGGTGKGVFANGIKQVRDVVKIDGKKFDPRDKFKFQNVSDSTQVVWLDDVKPELGFETFHSCLTDGWTIEKKYQDQFQIKPEDSPKLFIASNAIIGNDGTTNKRRQFVLEFGNHYSKNIINGNEKPIQEEHGCLFFEKYEWDKNEWSAFYSFMLECCEYYLKNGLVHYERKTVHLNMLRQKTSDDFVRWAELQSFRKNQAYDTSLLFGDFIGIYHDSDPGFKQRTFTMYLKEYAKCQNWQHDPYRSNNRQMFKFI